MQNKWYPDHFSFLISYFSFPAPPAPFNPGLRSLLVKYKPQPLTQPSNVSVTYMSSLLKKNSAKTERLIMTAKAYQ